MRESMCVYEMAINEVLDSSPELNIFLLYYGSCHKCSSFSTNKDVSAVEYRGKCLWVTLHHYEKTRKKRKLSCEVI